MRHHICVHGHFYQPPRENPWLEEVEQQESAYPYHDWNARVTAECYAPNSASRILDDEKRIVAIVNNYASISFNFGPTLLSWMQRHAKKTYDAVLAADKESQKKFSGHGAAMAQAYNHVIMPLANARDKRTQVLWGIRDFEYRFKRKPEGMWLPETAVDVQTLEVLAENGIGFTLLAQHQAKCVRRIGESAWTDVSGGRVDPRVPYLCRLPSGKSIALFFYDGAISQDVAFKGLLHSGVEFAKRLTGYFSAEHGRGELIHIATDGETYGHHHRHGDMALSFALHHIQSHDMAKMTIYAKFLEEFPPQCEAQIMENTSWSCAHGIDRWRSNCGCNTGRGSNWNQSWRVPLRGSMDWLQGVLSENFEQKSVTFFNDPWKARDDYVDVVLNRTIKNADRFLESHARRALSKEEKTLALKLLEMQHHAMLMFTSCGWFFDDISGIETVQVMLHAARAMQLSREIDGDDAEPAFVRRLETAQSNVPMFQTGAHVYEMFVKPSVVDLPRVTSHYAIASLFEEYPESAKVYSFTAKRLSYDRDDAGNQKYAVGKLLLRSNVTLEERLMNFFVLHLGDHNVMCGVKENQSSADFAKLQEEMKDAFTKNNIPVIVRLMDRYFGAQSFSLMNLFKDEQHKILNIILSSALEEVESSYRQIYEHHYPMMQMMQEMRLPVPRVLAVTLEFVIRGYLRRLFEEEKLDVNWAKQLVEDARRWSVDVDKPVLNYVASQKITQLMEKIMFGAHDLALLQTVHDMIGVAEQLGLELNVWEAQNIYFSMHKKMLKAIEPRASQTEESGDASRWISLFQSLGTDLRVKG